MTSWWAAWTSLLPLDAEVGHVTDFGQWDIGTRNLKNVLAVWRALLCSCDVEHVPDNAPAASAPEEVI